MITKLLSLSFKLNHFDLLNHFDSFNHFGFPVAFVLVVMEVEEFSSESINWSRALSYGISSKRYCFDDQRHR